MASKVTKSAKTDSKSYALTREDIREHGGRYVALIDGKIVAAGKDVFRKAQRLRRANPTKEVIITYVPTEDLLVLCMKRL